MRELFRARSYARQAALALSTIEEAVSPPVELLQDIKTAFEQKRVNRLSTVELLEVLCADIESPWLTYNRGNPLSARQLAKRLKEFGITSKNIRMEKILKGYELDDFADAFSRYLPSAIDNKISSATALQPNHNAASPTHLSATEHAVLYR